MCLGFYVKTRPSSSVFFFSLVHHQCSPLNSVPKPRLNVFSLCSSAAWLFNKRIHLYRTWEHSSPVQVDFPRPANHTMFIHLQTSLSTSKRKLHSFLQMQATLLSGYIVFVFTHQTLGIPVPSLYKPVPWKPESPGARESGRRREEGGGGGG